MTDQYSHLSLAQAAHLAAKRAKGGVVAIAASNGYNPRTFQNCLNPSSENNHFRLEHFEAVLEWTRSPLILDAVGALANVTWIDLGQFESVGDMAVLETITDLVSKVGKLTQSLQDALADGRVDEDEMYQLKAASRDLQAATHAVLMRAEQFLE